MKLLKIYSGSTDKSKSIYFRVLSVKRYSLFQIAFDLENVSDNYDFPYVQITIGMKRLLGLVASVHRFGVYLDILGKTWYHNK
tara:strand:- start:158 stop:406 length:249 start_codon:yes stop_codon:yes gene_type:complete